MRWIGFTAVLFVAALSLGAKSDAPGNRVLGVVNSALPFSIGSVTAKPEAGSLAVVDGDQVSSAKSAVTFRLNGENRAILGGNSITRIRSTKDDGAYFYLNKGSIQYDARKEPLAICARDRLYVPSIPGSGEVVIVDNKVQVRLTAGTMVRSGSEVCTEKAVPPWLAVQVNAAVTAGTAAGAATATATATAAGAGIAAGVPAVATIGIATATAAGVVVAAETSQPPASQSPTTPGQ